MKNFSVIETGGKQYKVSVGDKLKVERLKAETGGALIFDKVLLKADGDRVEVGTPYLSGEKVEAKVLNQGRDKKKIIFRYHSKTRYRKKKGHRQPYTELEITKI
ncbi:MAG: 50S ribosomal protein L21 [Candidatus Liptonbacteria bacterium]|nr:50S ribosomal protein L21 [Candidatus Liptonbacteria bacterium]